MTRPLLRGLRRVASYVASQGAGAPGLATYYQVTQAICECPRPESNQRTRFRKPLLYPLSYGGRLSAMVSRPRPPPLARAVASAGTRDTRGERYGDAGSARAVSVELPLAEAFSVRLRGLPPARATDARCGFRVHSAPCLAGDRSGRRKRSDHWG